MPQHRRRLALEPLEDRRVPTTFADPRFVDSRLAGGLTNPTSLVRAADGRLFVTEQGGNLRVIQANGTLVANPVVSLATDSRGERGLLGAELDPNFAANGFIYLYYTVPGGAGAPFNRVSRFTLSGNAAVPGSETVLLNLEPLSGATNHNGGAMHFGPDGKLYVAVGENANPAFSQQITNRLGKMLRINPDGSIPSDNPTSIRGISGTTTGLNRAIYAAGLRNPFTFAFQPGTGRLFINDVGGQSFEEINEGAAGANYGWPGTEGDFNQASFQNFTRPVYAYAHGFGELQGFAITGGAFYNPAAASFPSNFAGDYFFVDLVTNRIYVRDAAAGGVTTFARDLTGSTVVDLDVLPDGSLLYLSRTSGSSGAVHRVQFAPNSAPVITAQPVGRTAAAGEAVTFSVTAASGAGPISYQWFRNGVAIAGATGPTFTLANAQLANDGARFRVDVTNRVGTTRSNDAVLRVIPGQRPTATITLPGPGTTFRAGDTITFAGSASDPETGALPPSAFTWRVDYVTSIASGNPQVRPFVPPTRGITSGSFTAAVETPYLLTDVVYRITLTVTDPSGLTRTVTRDVLPAVANFTLTTNLAGVSLTLNGMAVPQGTTTTGVAGVRRTVGASPRVTVNGRTFVFAGWSDGGAITHDVFTPNATLVARYRSADVVAVAASGSPAVAVFDAATGTEVRRFFAYNPLFTGEVRVAVGDVDGDGVADVITAAGPGGGPHVQVFSGATGAVIRSFFPYNPAFSGGVYVASGDVDGDGFADIVTGLGPGGGPHVQVFSGRTGETLMSFFAYAPEFAGGVNVAAGDFTGDGRAEVVAAAGPGGGPHVQVFAAMTGAVLQSFFAFNPLFPGGVNIAAADFDGDGRADLATSIASGGTPHVRVLRGTDLAELASFFAYAPVFAGGVRVGAADTDGDGVREVVTGPGPGAGPDVRSFGVPGGALESARFAFDPAFLGGVYVGGG